MSITISGSTGVAGNNGTAGTPTYQGEDTNTGIFFPAADTIAFAEGGAEVARFDSSGNLGLGTASPSGASGRVLEINGGAGQARLVLKNDTTGSTSSDGSQIALVGSQLVIQNRENSEITFETNLTERARIDSSGNLLVGGTSAFSSAAGRGNISVNGSSTAIVAIGAGGARKGYLYTGGTDVELGADNILAFSAGATERARIDSSGNLLVGTTSGTGERVQISGAVGAGTAKIQVGANGNNGITFANATGGTSGSITVNASTVAYNTSSDYRLKENVAPMQNALDTVAQLNPVTYTWKADGSAGQGFIAHELQAVVPDCVTGEKDAVDAEGNPQYQGVDTSFLVATLVAAIKEQQATITELTARVAQLEAQ